MDRPFTRGPDEHFLENINFAALVPSTEDGWLFNRVLYIRGRPEMVGRTWGYLLTRLFTRA